MVDGWGRTRYGHADCSIWVAQALSFQTSIPHCILLTTYLPDFAEHVYMLEATVVFLIGTNPLMESKDLIKNFHLLPLTLLPRTLIHNIDRWEL